MKHWVIKLGISFVNELIASFSGDLEIACAIQSEVSDPSKTFLLFEGQD